MFIDSHCHLDRLDLKPYPDFADLMEQTQQAKIEHMLCVSIDLENYPAMLALVEDYPFISVSVGVHPNTQDQPEVTVEQLVKLAQHPKNVAIGETGLDYFRSEGDLEWQRDRFRVHIEAAKQAQKPLIIHTRQAKEDTLQILKAENAEQAGGVLHCFSEDWQTAKQALEIGFYISFSGIITFKTAAELRDVVAKVPLDKILIETDAPYLAPVPFRGKPNEPRYVAKVAEKVAEIKGISLEKLAEITRQNYHTLFSS